MTLSHLLTPEERTRLRHAVLVVGSCLVYSAISLPYISADPQLRSWGFIPAVPRLMLVMLMGYGSIIALAVAAWVTLYNSAFFIGRMRKQRAKHFEAKP